MRKKYKIPPPGKRPVRVIQRVKIAHSFLQSASNLLHFIVLKTHFSKWRNRPLIRSLLIESF